MTAADSKNSFANLKQKILSSSGKDYWRSIEEFIDSPHYRENVGPEFPENADTWDDSLSRRNFLKVMGASLALAGLSGCVIQPPEKIVPQVRQTEDVLPGKPLFYATAMPLGAIATGLLVKSYDGRPIKIEGNPSHPGSLGGTDVRAQASLLDLYDPDRAKETLFRGSPRGWPNFVTAVRGALEEHKKDGGAGLRFLTETVNSPTLLDQFKRLFTELPNAKLVQYEPFNQDNALEGSKLAFGTAVNTVYRFDKADRILSLDADPFSGFNARYIADIAKKRAFDEETKQMSRLYAVETTTTLFGAKADHRLAIKPSKMVDFAKAVAKALGVSGVDSNYQENAAWIAALAKDLLANKGKSVVIVGDNQPPVVHALAHLMNAVLGSVGNTLEYTETLTPYEKPQIEQLRELVADIDSGKVKTLVILGGNPVYTTPADLKLDRDRLEKVPLRVYLGSHRDETSVLCHWHISAKHYLESWSDALAYDGTASVIQPLVVLPYETRNAHEVVQLFFNENYDRKDYDIVRDYWQRTWGFASSSGQPQPAGAFEDKWRLAVHDGVIQGTAYQPKQVSANISALNTVQPQKQDNFGPLEISILPDPSIYDGRFTNNGWLQELPNPLTKITWENVALVSPATAERLGLNRSNDPREISGGERGEAFINTRGNNMGADLVTLKYQGSAINKPVPVWISPGQPDDVITIFTGYGRTRAGNVGTGLGYNAFDVRRSDSLYFGTGDISKTGEKANIVSTQIHFNMEGRDILRTFDVDVYAENPTIGHQPNEYPKTIYQSGAEYYQQWYKTNRKWGMSIDLNACVGCNSCIIACQSENNIPVVGKEQVERSREMHWLRVDTYYTGTSIDSPGGVGFQPVPCQQCEQAPCEVVCPVTATVHNPEGLNDMVYNRCVGTRYCSNNCPYKVRRFNFLLYQDWYTPQYKLMRNPEVTIRSRGVMEKCTYCVQRIAAARIEAEKDGRPVRDGEVLTACQSACPANAIVFGDMNDPVSKIAAAKKDHRNYILLNELNTQPRTTYLAALKNQNKEMPDYRPLPIPKSHGGEKNNNGSSKEAHTGGEAH
jgi:molybdopterin-containing oxidoreductase family iron-sulfur binding subunit